MAKQAWGRIFPASHFQRRWSLWFKLQLLGSRAGGSVCIRGHVLSQIMSSLMTLKFQGSSLERASSQDPKGVLAIRSHVFIKSVKASYFTCSRLRPLSPSTPTNHLSHFLLCYMVLAWLPHFGEQAKGTWVRIHAVWVQYDTFMWFIITSIVFASHPKVRAAARSISTTLCANSPSPMT